MRIKAIYITIFILLFSITLSSCKSDSEIEFNKGKNTIIETNEEINDKTKPNDAAYILAGKFKNLDSFNSYTSGSTNAKKGIIKYDQKINNKFIKNYDEYFFEAISKSSIVNMSHQSFYKNDKVVYRDSQDGPLLVSTPNDYQNVYGVLPSYLNTIGFILNEESILKSELETNVDDKYSYKYILDNNLSTEYLKRQMKEFGSLKNYPEFSKVELKITLDKFGNPLSISSYTEYIISINILGKMNCTQTLNTTFSDINSKVNIPNHEEFNQAIGENPSEIPDTEIIPPSIIEQLMDYLLNYNVDKGISIKGDISVNDLGINMKIPLELALSFDIEDINIDNIKTNLNLVFETYIAGYKFNLIYNGDNPNNLYITLNDKKITIDLAKARSELNIDFEKLFIIEKTDLYFKISLTDVAIMLINNILNPFNINLEPLNIYLHIEDNRIRYVYLDTKLKDLESNSESLIKAEFVIYNKDLILPNLSDYNDKIEDVFNDLVNDSKIFNNIKEFKNIYNDLASLNYENGYQFKGFLNIKMLMNLKLGFEANFYTKDTLKALIKIDFTTLNSFVLNMLQEMIGIDLTEINISYEGDGYLYLVIKNETNILDMIKIGPNIFIGKDLTSLIIYLYNMLNDLDFIKTDTNTKGTFGSYTKEKIITILNHLADSLGEDGTLLKSFIPNKLETIEFNISKENEKANKFNLLIEQNNNDNISTFLNLDLDIKELDKNYFDNINNNLEYEKFSKAKKLITDINTLANNFENSDNVITLENKANIESLIKKYNELDDNLKPYIYNYDELLVLKDCLIFLEAEVTRFKDAFYNLKENFNENDFNDLNKLYDSKMSTGLGYFKPHKKSYRDSVIKRLDKVNDEYLEFRDSILNK